MAGLGWSKISIPAHFSASFSHFHRKFALCLSSSNGVVVFGDVVPKFNLTYTPLIFNKVSTASSWYNGDTSSDYFIGVKSIKINGNITVPFNTTLLKINKEGSGGTKISTVQPYTVLHTSIHKPLINAFARQLSKVPRVAAVAPFDLCFNSSGIGSTRVGPAVPRIDLVLQSSNVIWSIFGANSMVEVKKDVLCLGFIDGGFNPRTTIVIGGHQVEDNLLQFDLAGSRLGFKQTSCANFNFTPKA
ncbi:Probable aspartic proteinase GIP2 [Linum grandiflorum]